MGHHHAHRLVVVLRAKEGSLILRNVLFVSSHCVLWIRQMGLARVVNLSSDVGIGQRLELCYTFGCG